MDDTLPTRISPVSSSMSVASVNVPPMSMPSRYAIFMSLQNRVDDQVISLRNLIVSPSFTRQASVSISVR